MVNIFLVYLFQIMLILHDFALLYLNFFLFILCCIHSFVYFIFPLALYSANVHVLLSLSSCFVSFRCPPFTNAAATQAATKT